MGSSRVGWRQCVSAGSRYGECMIAHVSRFFFVVYSRREPWLRSHGRRRRRRQVCAPALPRAAMYARGRGVPRFPLTGPCRCGQSNGEWSGSPRRCGVVMLSVPGLSGSISVGGRRAGLGARSPSWAQFDMGCHRKLATGCVRYWFEIVKQY